MKRLMRIISTMLVLVMVSSAMLTLVGCGGGRGAYDPENFLPNGTPDNPYQIVKEPVTVYIFVPRGSMNPAYSSMKMFKVLERVTNLKLEFREADTAAYTDMRTAAWANRRDLPDLFLFSNSVSEQVSYSKLGALAPLNDDNYTVDGIQVGNIIDNYMPTYKALLDSNFGSDTTINAKEVATLEDGKMYSVVTYNNVPRDMTYKMWINQKWIDNINNRYLYDDPLPNAEDIRTVEDYIRVLKAFRDYDANANSIVEDEIPVTAVSLQYLRWYILASYGYVSDGIEINAAGDEFVYVPTTEAYRKYLETMRYLFDEKLLDNDTFSIKTDADITGKGYDNLLGSMCTAAPYLTVGDTYADDYELLRPLTSTYYEGPAVHHGFSTFEATGSIIPSTTPYVREVARLLDIMYTEMGRQLIAYGEEGVDFSWEDSDKTSFVVNVPSDWRGTQEEFRATLSPNVGTGAHLIWDYSFVGKMNDPVTRKLNTLSEEYIPYLKQPVPEALKLTEEGYKNSKNISINLSNYIESAEYDFIVPDSQTSKDPTKDADWSAFQAKLLSYKYDELLAIYNEALAAYLAK